MRLGVRAHDFGKLPLETLAAQIAAHGFTCVQLAPPKAIAGFEPHSQLTPGFAWEVREVFARHGIQIAVLGCYINLGDANEASRRAQLARFKEHVRFARDFGCSIVGTETGSINSDYSWHVANHAEAAYQTVLASTRELVREAERFGVFVCIEGVERYVISSPQRLRRLVDEVDSPNLQVIFDPVNLLCAKNHQAEAQIIADALGLLGERICIVHAKDFTLRADGQYQECPAGSGRLDYAPVLRWIKANKPSINVLLENTHPSTVAGTAQYLRERYASA